MFSTFAKQVIRKTAFTIVRAHDPVVYFHSNQYLRQTARRLEHLASLGIPVAGTSVLEIGAGIGDLSHFYTDRGCTITITEARPENLEYLKTRYPDCNIRALDMEQPSPVEGSPFDVVHCYGLLYHLSNPGKALEYLSQSAGKLLFLETCVSFGDGDSVNLISEKQYDLTQALSGTGCRPTRSWVFNKLGEFFKYVYIPKTQPWHEEFPLDWTAPEKHAASLQRAIFIASHEPLEQDVLVSSLIMKQSRHE